MLRTIARIGCLVMTCSSIAVLAAGCDQGEGTQIDAFESRVSEEPPDAARAVSWDAVPVPALVTNSLTYDAPEQPAQQHHAHLPHWLNVETFVFSTMTDSIAVTSAAGGLFAPYPEDIPLLEEEVIDNGFLLAAKIYDEDANLVGYGTEQEEQDLANATALTTFTFTIPGRGTLMLAQEEDFTVFFDEIADMIDDGEPIRSFEPPLSAQTTINGTGVVVGGTGEFEGIHGFMREFDIAYEINLIDQAVDLTLVIQVMYW